MTNRFIKFGIKRGSQVMFKDGRILFYKKLMTYFYKVRIIQYSNSLSILYY